MKKIPLTPYPGDILFTRKREEVARTYKNTYGKPLEKEYAAITIPLKNSVYVVWAPTPVWMAHEFSHVLLQMFRYIGSDPADGNGEPFCYMLGHLMSEAMKK